VNSQSAKATGVGGQQRGFEPGGEKARGSRKRHLLVDAEGLVVEAKARSAKVSDQDGLRRLCSNRLVRAYLAFGTCG
jgi:hypothetical protein